MENSWEACLLLIYYSYLYWFQVFFNDNSYTFLTSAFVSKVRALSSFSRTLLQTFLLNFICRSFDHLSCHCSLLVQVLNLTVYKIAQFSSGFSSFSLLENQKVVYIGLCVIFLFVLVLYDCWRDTKQKRGFPLFRWNPKSYCVINLKEFLWDLEWVR